MTRRLLAAYLLLFCINSSPAQNKEISYPKGYFTWPVGTEPAIVANFGELRKNHYHMGLDARTNAEENYPIYAAASGYVSKVKIEPFGFGRCIYINHPNGLTTVYAHLNDFYPELDAYVKKRQYQAESWKIFIEDIPPGKFPLKKGTFIANSGNTGGSQGPHLHFEIRDTKTDKVLNPLLFDMPIRDNIAPDILRLAIYDRNLSTYEQSPRLFNLKKTAGHYSIHPNLIEVNSEKVSLGITAFDRYSGSGNQNGIFKAVLYDNEKRSCGFEMDSISYDETRYLNAHIDYKTKMTGGPYIQHLSRLPGNRDVIYRDSPGDGVIELGDGAVHDIRIEVFDVNGNKSVLKFSLKGKPSGQVKKYGAGNFFQPGYLNIFENNEVNLYLPEEYLYDAFGFRYNKNNSTGRTIHQLHHPMVPVHKYFTVRIKPETPFRDTGKIIMKRSYGDKDDYKKAYFENSWYKAEFREFGNYELLEDNTPPVIIPAGFHNGMNSHKVKTLRFTVTDNCEEIKSFSGTLDGQWLLFSNDKGKTFIYQRDDKWTVGAHELKIMAEDLAGNKTIKTFNFTE